ASFVCVLSVFSFQAEDGIRDRNVTGVQTCALPILGLLYQAPEASADSSEVSDGIRFAAAQGPDLERALASAEAALPLTANFRLRSEERRVGKESSAQLSL